MGFLFSGVFWGLFLVLIGISIILKAFFHLHIPIFRTFFALLVIYIGIRMLLGGGVCGRNDWKNHCGGSNSAIFCEKSMAAAAGDNTYQVIFGSGTIDLRSIPAPEKNSFVEINVIFGQGDIQLNPQVSYRINATSIFGNAQMPDKSNTAFGTYLYKSKNFSDTVPCVTIKSNTIFGQTTFVHE